MPNSSINGLPGLANISSNTVFAVDDVPAAAPTSKVTAPQIATFLNSYYLQILNNLNDLNNFPNARNNLGVLKGYRAVGGGLTTLTNPCPTYILATPTLGNDTTIKFPPMNATTINAKSLSVGDEVVVQHGGDAGSNVNLQYASGAVVPLQLIRPTEYAVLRLIDNSTSNGTFAVQKIGTAALMPASDTSSATNVLAAALNPTIAWNGKFAVYADGNGSLGNSQISPSALLGLVSTVTGTSQTIAVGTWYTNTAATLCTFTLPATSNVGDIFAITGQGSGGWKIAQGAGQKIIIGASSSTLGATGYIASSHVNDAIVLRCTVANTIWATQGSPQGNISLA